MGTLFDEQTGRRVRISRSGCQFSGPGLINGPWLVFDCGSVSAPAPELYSLANGSWHSVTLDSRFQVPCGYGAQGCAHYSPVDAGRYWLKMVGTQCAGGGNEHCSWAYQFQKLQTGEVRSDPTRRTTVADLNLPGLSRKLCAPLRVPLVPNDVMGPIPGLLVQYGRFAVAQRDVAQRDGGLASMYLERCGSRLHRPLSNAGSLWAANTQAVIWQVTASKLSGLFLPDLRPFTIHIPVRALRLICAYDTEPDCVSAIALTKRHLYLINDDYKLWIANSPVEPRAHR